MKNLLSKVLSTSVIERIKKFEKSKKSLNKYNGHSYAYYVFDYSKNTSTEIKIEEYCSSLKNFEKDLKDLRYIKNTNIENTKLIENILNDMNHNVLYLKIKSIWICDDNDIILANIEEKYSYGKRLEFKDTRNMIVAITKEEFNLL